MRSEHLRETKIDQSGGWVAGVDANLVPCHIPQNCPTIYIVIHQSQAEQERETRGLAGFHIQSTVLEKGRLSRSHHKRMKE
jgi:hypothetical protein